MNNSHAVIALTIAAALSAGCATTTGTGDTGWPQEPRRPDDTVRTTPPSQQPLQPQQPVHTPPPSAPVPVREVRSWEEERRRHPWEVALGGTGSNDDTWDVGGASATVNVGYYFTEMVELVVRQSASYSDDLPVAGTTDTESVWNFQTRVALDLHFPIGCFVPYVGVNVGYLYGDSDAPDDTLAGGVEGGAKIYVQPDAFLQAHIEWEFFEDRQQALDNSFRENFDDGAIFYFIGFGLRF